MTNELCLNGFSAVTENEMMEMDGGSWEAAVANLGAVAACVAVCLAPEVTVPVMVASIIAEACFGAAAIGEATHP